MKELNHQGMEKRIVPFFDENQGAAGESWLDLESVADFEITSEDPEHPIDSAIAALGNEAGWQAANPGEQLIRLCFTKPQAIRRIRLVFEETDNQRSQEFVLRWSPTGIRNDYREIVRQQYNFSPPGTAQEIEDYRVNLDEVKVLELRIVPAISSSDAYATLKELRVA
jgi:hypothetical protein